MKPVIGAARRGVCSDAVPLLRVVTPRTRSHNGGSNALRGSLSEPHSGNKIASDLDNRSSGAALYRFPLRAQRGGMCHDCTQVNHFCLVTLKVVCLDTLTIKEFLSKGFSIISFKSFYKYFKSDERFAKLFHYKLRAHFWQFSVSSAVL